MLKLLSKNSKNKRKPIYEKHFWNMWHTLKRIVHKKISDEIVADIAFTCVFEEFQRNQFEILSKKWAAIEKERNKKARLNQFIVAVAKYKLIDCLRKLFGRKQPPKWIKKLGPQYIETYNQLFNLGMLEEEILDKDRHDPEAYRKKKQIIDHILNNNTTTQSPQDFENNTPSVEEIYFEKEKEFILLTISNIIFGVNPDNFFSKTASSFIKKSQQLINELDLSDKELNLIKQIYQNNLHIKDAGKNLSLSESQSRRLHDKTKDKILASFKKLNLVDELSLLILEEQTI